MYIRSAVANIGKYTQCGIISVSGHYNCDCTTMNLYDHHTKDRKMKKASAHISTFAGPAQATASQAKELNFPTCNFYRYICGNEKHNQNIPSHLNNVLLRQYGVRIR